MEILSDNKQNGRLDWFILIPIIGLMLFSLGFVFSASAQKSLSVFGESTNYLISHAVKVVVGIIIMFVFAKLDYHVWQRYSKVFILFSIIPLVLVFFAGKPQNNVYRWLEVGPLFSFQPSELAKFALITHIATLLTERQPWIKTFKYGMMPPLIWTGIIATLIALQPNFSTAFATYLIAMGMMFIGNINLLHIIYTGIGCSVIAAIYAVSADYRVQRLTAFISNIGNQNVLDDGAYYQTGQAIIAFGNGGLFGLGAGQSRQSNLFLPESFGDFIYAIIGEEYGFLGAGLIIIAFLLILWRGIVTIRNAKDNYGYFLAAGIVITFTFYAMINAGVNCGIFPNTGVPMPFISYGGTAIFIYAAAIGTLLNISSQAGNLSLKQTK